MTIKLFLSRVATIALGTAAFASSALADTRIDDAQQAVAAGKDPIPGPRSCFWARGPVSADPYLNIAYPDFDLIRSLQLSYACMFFVVKRMQFTVLLHQIIPTVSVSIATAAMKLR